MYKFVCMNVCVCLSVCLSVCLCSKRERLELLTPKSVEIWSLAGQMLQGYQVHFVCGRPPVDMTGHFSSFNLVNFLDLLQIQSDQLLNSGFWNRTFASFQECQSSNGRILHMILKSKDR